jgi:hypothetical protein
MDGDDHEERGEDLIDLAWERHLRECEGRCGDCHCNHPGPAEKNRGCICYDLGEGVDPVHEYDPEPDEHEFCGPLRGTTVLLRTQWKFHS